MSVISDRHNVVPFKAGKSAPLEGQRLAKVGYKNTAKQKAKYESVCASVPKISDDDIADSGEQLIPYVRTLLESAQDGILRSLYESSDGTLSSVSDSELSVQACINYLEAESSGGRLKSETVEAWFDQYVAENLIVPMAEKLGFTDLGEDQMSTVNRHISAYRQVISSLCSGKTFLQPKQITGCRFAIQLASEDTDVGERLLKRLESMETRKIVELLDL
jgi:hypothetical protein